MVRQFLTIPEVSPSDERVFSFAGLTLSDMYKSLLEGTLDDHLVPIGVSQNSFW